MTVQLAILNLASCLMSNLLSYTLLAWEPPVYYYSLSASCHPSGELTSLVSSTWLADQSRLLYLTSWPVSYPLPCKLASLSFPLTSWITITSYPFLPFPWQADQPPVLYLVSFCQLISLLFSTWWALASWSASVGVLCCILITVGSGSSLEPAIARLFNS